MSNERLKIDKQSYLFLNKFLNDCGFDYSEDSQEMIKKKLIELFEVFLVTDPCGLFTEEEYKKNFE